MEKFSDTCDTPSQIEMEIYEKALTQWSTIFLSGYRLIKLPNGDIGISTRISVDAGSDSPLLIEEPIVIGLHTSNIEEKAPYVFPDRLNFPFDKFPHINYANENIPQTLCLTREPIEEWYAEHTFGDYINLVSQWLEDADKGKLMKLNRGDEYESFRIENVNGCILYDATIDKRFLHIDRNISFYCKVYSNDNINIEGTLISLENPFDANGIEIILTRSSSLILNDWFVNYPKTYGELVEFSQKYDFNIENDEISNILNKFSNKVEKFFFRFVFMRPQKVIGKEYPIDSLCFKVRATDFLNGNLDAKVEGIVMIDKISVESIGTLTQTPKSIQDKKILVLGCGAVGSKLIFHLYRSGITQLTICDKDTLLPHNICRHALFSSHNFKNKAIAITEALENKLFLHGQIEAITEDITDWLPKANLLGYGLIIDCTASSSVSRCLSGICDQNNVPIVRVALSDLGNIGLVYVNYNRQSSLDDYYMQLLREADKDGDIKEWISKEKRYNYDYVRIGEGCHSNTMKLNDDVISAHVAIASNIIRHLFEGQKGNTAYLSFANLYYEGSMDTDDYPIPAFERLTCPNENQWEVRIPSDLLRKIRVAAKVGGKKETGGYLMGYVEEKYHRIYILFTYIPKDSIKLTNRILLSTKGWKEFEQKISDVTAGKVCYLGDWHSHTKSDLTPSTIDENTYKYLKESELKTKYGIGLITNGQHTNAYLL